MTTPVVIRLQSMAADPAISITATLRLAKLVVAKLGLDEFQGWIDRELGGFDGEPPDYRKLKGTPEVQHPLRGWQALQFDDQQTYDMFRECYVGEPMSQLQALIDGAQKQGKWLGHAYSIDQQKIIWELTGHQLPARVKLQVHQFVGIVDQVRTVLTDWTLALEKQGVLGEGLMFSEDEKDRSAAPTAQVVHSYNMGDVGAFVQHAEHSTVTGSVGGTFDVGKVESFVGQVRQQEGNLPPEAWAEIAPQLEALEGELRGEKRQPVLTKALKAIGGVCVKVGSNIAASGIEHMVAQLLGVV
ncbi:MAG: AbiTii domain-containing protein [Caulobacteraceae bacterium]